MAKLTNENTALKNELQRKTQEFNKKIKGSQDFLDQKEQLEQELAALKRTMEEKLHQQEKKLA